MENWVPYHLFTSSMTHSPVLFLWFCKIFQPLTNLQFCMVYFHTFIVIQRQPHHLSKFLRTWTGTKTTKWQVFSYNVTWGTEISFPSQWDTPMGKGKSVHVKKTRMGADKQFRTAGDELLCYWNLCYYGTFDTQTCVQWPVVSTYEL